MYYKRTHCGRTDLQRCGRILGTGVVRKLAGLLHDALDSCECVAKISIIGCGVAPIRIQNLPELFLLSMRGTAMLSEEGGGDGGRVVETL